ncbi:hypothetical protein TNCV_1900281 [Trichonephila clavipes]|nr:hypothetical protein TNCV_1900281 [Trichonephila clavipes]
MPTKDRNMHRVCNHIVSGMLNEDQSADEVKRELKNIGKKMDFRNVSKTFTSHGESVLLLKGLTSKKDVLSRAETCVSVRRGGVQSTYHFKITWHLDVNQLQSVPRGSLKSLRRLQKLWLNGNQLREIPSQALSQLPELEAL